MSRVDMKRKVLSENDRLAAKLRERFERDDVFCVNIISAPGSGKTSLLEQTLARLSPGDGVAVLTGDIRTENDADRLARFPFPIRQITTGGACHLDAKMVQHALDGWELAALRVLFIENVGNLVCPASFDLGEAFKVAVFSVTEGEDKPLKYPGIFSKARAVVLNKIDLLPHVAFDVDVARENVQKSHPGITLLETSCTTGQGVDEWMKWLEGQRLLTLAEAHATG